MAEAIETERSRARRRAAHPELAGPAASRSRHAHRLTWPGSNRRCGTPVPSAARQPARARAAACSSSPAVTSSRPAPRPPPAVRASFPWSGPCRESARAERTGTGRAARGDRRVARSHATCSPASRSARSRSSTQVPLLPTVKALLSIDGGVCPRDGTALEYDPWSPFAHRCPRCSETVSGDRHHRWWARFQHLWLGERIAHLAALATLGRERPRPAPRPAVSSSSTAPAISTIPTATTCSALRGSSSPPISSRSGSPTSSRRRSCSGPPEQLDQDDLRRGRPHRQ